MGVWGGGDVSCIPCVRRFACTRPLRSAKGRFFPSALMCFPSALMFKGELMGVWGGCGVGGGGVLPFAKRRGRVRSTQGMHEICHGVPVHNLPPP